MEISKCLPLVLFSMCFISTNWFRNLSDFNCQFVSVSASAWA